MRVIARMSGGAAHQVRVLTDELSGDRFDQLLVTGALGQSEEEFELCNPRAAVGEHRLPGLRPELRPWDDVRALAGLVRLIRRRRPDILETHTAKAGALGRLAALIAGRPRPAIVHWYHGHVLSGYYALPISVAYRTIERGLASFSDRLICVSEATRRDLVGLGIAPHDRFEVIRPGLDLESFRQPSPALVERVRRELGAADPEIVLVGFVGRLVEIKRVDLLLEAFAVSHRARPELRLAIVGDGPLSGRLRDQSRRLGIDAGVCFTGFRHDTGAVVAALDIGVLTSDSEGAPLSLIEAAAGGRCVVATRVGGVPEVVAPDSGRLVPAGDVPAIASAFTELAADPDLRARLGAGGRRQVDPGWSVARLRSDVERLYATVLEERRDVA